MVSPILLRDMDQLLLGEKKVIYAGVMLDRGGYQRQKRIPTQKAVGSLPIKLRKHF
jgi:hypothetical protein